MICSLCIYFPIYLIDFIEISLIYKIIDESLPILFRPQIVHTLIRPKYSPYPQQTRRHSLHINFFTYPHKFSIVALVIVDLDYYLSRYVLVVRDCHVYIRCVTSLASACAVCGYFVGNYVESVACVESYILVFRGVVDTVLTYELQRTVTLISFENSYGSFR